MIAGIPHDCRDAEQDEPCGEHGHHRRRRQAPCEHPVLQAHQGRKGCGAPEERGAVLVKILPQIERRAGLYFGYQERGRRVEKHGREQDEKEKEEVPITEQAEVPHRPPQEDMSDKGEGHPEQVQPIEPYPPTCITRRRQSAGGKDPPMTTEKITET